MSDAMWHTRRLLGRTALVTGLIFITGSAFAQAPFPNRPIRLVSGFAPGGATDVVARLIAQSLSDALGQSVVVDNKPGAAGNIAADFVARQPADGHTLYLANATLAMPSMFPKITFDVKKDLVPVSMIASGPSVLAVNPKLPVRSVRELVAYAQQNPGKLDFGSGGIGNITHMSMELFNYLAKVDIKHVPYKGGAPSTTAAVAGEVQVLMAAAAGTMAHIKAGTLVPLGVSGRTRAQALPDVPTIAEAGVAGYEATSWYGVVTAAGTPKAVVDRIDQAIRAGIKRPEVREKMLSQGMDPMEMGSEEFGRFLQTEIDKWAKIIARADIRAE
ncbi:Bug family tripartite tricarboxylate transporter substrate binding protein [Hydrogenophaga sp. BPS33]|uniref:Bug family tripartite tricarboxylate transporter substrate binding protein n=1 Tax=Hydrogenophaga sp. BPS33 TaxID=2651974 RepID=UPI00131FFAD5|nr:tripartite tricarboxylate transporter substrate binding protein [Hydrogenophaga sp. BPS33]QHE89323.1 tripartite tricarboxylate transporter substrate binding protein [Hydrogenophaga sp. BPS33]